jgi:amino acid transporter
VLLILALMVLVFVWLATRGGPRGQTLNRRRAATAFRRRDQHYRAGGNRWLFAFAGFESAGPLGEEAHRPGRLIPRAMLAAIALGAVFYVACMLAQSWGFGTDKAGVAAFAGSSAPLVLDYVGAPMAAVLDLIAVISAVGAGLGCVVVAIRMLYALGRDRMLPQALAAVSPVSGSPTVALRAEMAFGLVTLIVFRLAGIAPIRMFFLLARLGVLNLLVMYAATDYAAVRHLWPTRRRSALLPALGVVVAGYVLLRNVWPPPHGGWCLLVIAWLIVGADRFALPPATITCGFGYFHGDTGAGPGASHQTGWTGLVAACLLHAPTR